MIREVVEGEAMEVIDKRKESKDEDWNVGDVVNNNIHLAIIAKNNDGKYVFETKSPNSTARTPMGSYDDEQYIDNDLYEVIKVLKENA